MVKRYLKWSRYSWRALAILAVAAFLGVGAVAQYYSTTGLAATGPEEVGAAPPTPLLNVPDDRSPILDFSFPNEVRSPLRPRNVVALTFDDGPDPTWTPQILEVLERHGATATFFTIGARSLEYPDLVGQIRADGHEIGNHTFSHQAMGAASPTTQRFELSTSNVALAGSGPATRIYRPPFSGRPSDLSADELASAKRSGYLIVLTDLVVRDWEDRSVDELVAAATPPSDAGVVITFHDGGGNRERTVQALDRILTILDQRGMRTATISEFAGLGKNASAEAAPATLRLSHWSLRAAVATIAGLSSAVRWGSLVLIALGVIRAVAVLVFARRNVRRERERERSNDGQAWTPPVSVLMPAYNEEVGIAAALRSLAASDYPNFEIVVIDDGSTDRTAEIAASTGLDNVRVVSQANAGKAEALNNGARHASFDIVVLIDGDTVFEPDTLRHLVAPLVDPTVGAVGGTVKVGNRKGLLGRWQHIEYVVSCVAERRMFDEMGCVPCVPGAIGAYRKAALLQVNGVPTQTLAEDTDLTIAVQRAGWSVAFAPRARAWTEVPLTFKSLWRQRYRWNYGTMQAIWKNRGAALEQGPGGRLGRFAFPYVLTFSLLFAVLAPLVDIFAIVALFQGKFQSMLLVWGAVNVLALVVAAYAFKLDDESLRPLWALPLQQFVHRQMMYLVVLASFRSALRGTRLRWHKLERTGLAHDVALGVRR